MDPNTSPPHALDTGTRLAAERTFLAHERTQMAWVRTATSLISFGFTIYKFFEFEAERGTPVTGPLLTPRLFGMTMIGMGLVALFLSTIEHRQGLQRLRAAYGTAHGAAPRSVSAVVGAIISVVGLLAFLAAAFRG